MNKQRGIALPLALILAILYFGLIELLMIDSSREMVEARRFRARIVALTLAENGAELAAAGIVTPNNYSSKASAEDGDGKMSGEMTKTVAGLFDITATGAATGVEKAKAEVRLRGRVEGTKIIIDFAMHTQ